MDLRSLRYFATIAQEGSFQRASMQLHIAQPALSRQIRNLEEDLGVSLFARSTTGVKLTPAGQVLLAEVKELLARVELATSKTQRAALGQFGLIQIAFTSVIAEVRPTVAAVAAIRREMPEVDFRLHLVNAEEQVNLIQSGEIDVGVSYRFPPHPAGLVFRDLRVEHSTSCSFPRGIH